MRRLPLLALALLTGAAYGQDIKAQSGELIGIITTGKMKPGPATFTLRLEKKGAPLSVEEIKAKLTMPSMSGMVMEDPVVKPIRTPGGYSIDFDIPHPGTFNLDLDIPSTKDHLKFVFKVEGNSAPMAGMDMMNMRGNFTASMNQEASGTAWVPKASPMPMVMLPAYKGFDLHIMGFAEGAWGKSGGFRSESQFWTSSMVMVEAQKREEDSSLAFRVGLSLDALTNGKDGYPDLFQTGETSNNKPMVDRQHPHDFLMEAAAIYSRKLSAQMGGFVYIAPVGEPAIGTAAFGHRASAEEEPDAPITHHWNDGTHITDGVVTLGLTHQDKWKLEGSAFNGSEPNENRYDVESPKLNSFSGRLTFNPTDNWSFSSSYAFQKSPEALEPGVDVRRTVLGAAYSKDGLNVTGIWMRNALASGKSDGWLLEGTKYLVGASLFARYERVNKDELANVPAGDYRIEKFTFGGIKELRQADGLTYGLGASVSLYNYPAALDPFYGRNPVSLTVFLRVKPSG